MSSFTGGGGGREGFFNFPCYLKKTTEASNKLSYLDIMIEIEHGSFRTDAAIYFTGGGHSSCYGNSLLLHGHNLHDTSPGLSLLILVWGTRILKGTIS